MTTDSSTEARPSNGAGTSASQEVSWWVTHVFLAAVLAQADAGPLPMAGTPAWGALADNDPRKLLALAVAGEHHTLRMEMAQDAIRQAGEDIWAGADWSQASKALQRRREIDKHREDSAA